MIAEATWKKKLPLVISRSLLLLVLVLPLVHSVSGTREESVPGRRSKTPQTPPRGVREWVAMLRDGDYAGILDLPESGSLPGRIEDFAFYSRGLAAYESGKFELGEGYRMQLLEQYPGSIFGYYLAVDAAYHLLKEGRISEAQKLSGSAVREEPVFHREGSRFLFVRGKLLLDAGKELPGAGLLVQCVKRYPGTEAAIIAEKIVLPLLLEKGGQKGSGGLVRTALELGNALAGEGKFQEAASVLDLWRKKAGVAQRGRFDLALANSLRRMNRYTDAIRILSRTREGEPRATAAMKLFFAGIYTWYMGRPEEAEGILKGVLEKYGDTDAFYKAAFNLGRICEEAGRFQDAFTYYDTASTSKGNNANHESSFRKGYVKFLLGSYGEAEAVFTENLERFKDEEHFYRNLFMKAHSLEKQGEVASAGTIYERIAGEKRGGIYYFFSLRKLGKFPGWKAVGDVPFKNVTSQGYLETLLQENQEDDGGSHRLERALLFQKLGLFAFSLEELSRAHPRTLVPPGTKRRVRNAIYAYASGNYRRGIELSVGSGNVFDLKGVPYLDSPSYLQYPALSFVINRTNEVNVDPFFLHSIFRQESLFDYGVVSNAGAIGLGQIMPRTGHWIARQMRRGNFSLEILFDPVTNSSFAAYYLESLIELFRGDILLAAAAYNAGEPAVRRWRKKSGGDPYLFTEIIGYEETRKYVRKVFMNYLSYLRIYGEGWAGSDIKKRAPGGTS